MTQDNRSNLATKQPGGVAALDRMMAHAIRALGIDAIESAKSGHFGVPMGMADIATVLFGHFMKFDPTAPHWPDRDRFILSNGHGSMLLYALLYLTGYEDMTLDEVRRFRQVGSKTAGHPEYGHATGIETTTGPLGQGLANGVGMALAERLLNARFGNDLVDHYTYVFAGDGCLMEGISHEAIDLAGHLKLSKLIVLFDDNHISIDGPTSLTTDMDQLKRFEAAGWSVRSVDGHDADAIAEAIAAERETDRPSFIDCRTIIGLGAGAGAGTARAHGEGLTAEELAAAKESYGWKAGHFVVPERELSAWRAIGARGATTRKNWERRLAAAPADKRAAFEKAMAGDFSAEIDAAIAAISAKLAADKPKIATRVASQKVLEVLLPAVPTMVGGSADLTGSVGTKTAADSKPVTPTDFSGRYIHYGVREHGMAAAMNGLALHGGVIPYAGTFMAFADYSRPSIRLGALMGIRVIHVLTHDSIGLGQDGPTHQPVEHLAALRAIPNLLVLRPADAVETAEAWQLALKNVSGPTALVLTRQNVPPLRADGGQGNRAAKGAYVLQEAAAKRQVTLLASGSEVSLAVDAAKALASEGINAAVVSVPSFELFARQDRAYRDAVLGTGPRIAIEAAIRMSWDRYLRDDDVFIGMEGFGASGPGPDVFKHFGITSDAVVAAARKLVGKK